MGIHDLQHLLDGAFTRHVRIYTVWPVYFRGMVLVARFIQLFLRVERTTCGEPECRCRNHNLLVVTRFGWLTFLAFMLASLFLARGLR